MYRIEITKRANKMLIRMPVNQRLLIYSKIEEYAANPAEGRNVIKLSGEDGYRMRVGDWRVIFERDDEVLKIVVLAVGSRGGIYK